jgi:hypothetical protein
MHLSWRDGLATVLVGLAVVAYGAWALDSGFVGRNEADSVAVAVLALGVAASVSAVVPGFDELWHGSGRYLVVASALGLVALVAGVLAIIWSDAVALSILVISTAALWAMSTARHIGIGKPMASQTR